MADVKVRAKYRGQKPDRTWAEEGEVFEIETPAARLNRAVFDFDEPKPGKVEASG